ncbi:hypothetical protein ACIBM3_32460 [Rhodococcus erythropolis]|uniref:hypothetical protein n=1 Tax=Rhodococcus erythropolis TaxID=1833 RepID=UPI0037A24A2D
MSGQYLQVSHPPDILFLRQGFESFLWAFGDASISSFDGRTCHAVTSAVPFSAYLRSTSHTQALGSVSEGCQFEKCSCITDAAELADEFRARKSASDEDEALTIVNATYDRLRDG